MHAQTITVCETCNYTSIAKAIHDASPGTTLILKPGTYKEHGIIIDKSISLMGEGLPTIDGGEKGEIIKIVSDGVIIDGIRVINVGTSYTEDHAAIRVARSDHFTIQNVTLENLFFGIYLEKANNGMVRNNTIAGNAKEEFNSGNGIQLWYSENIQVHNNEISGVRDGIYLEFANNCNLSGNYSHNNIRYGLHFMFSNHDSYSNNTFENNGAGVAVMFSKEIQMFDNSFINNWGPASYGLLLKEINDAEIIGNRFESNTIGISIEGSNRVNYQKNDFRNNGWAIKSRGACYANRFERNNFLYNSFDLAYNSKLNDNVFQQNYWSNYTGYDLDNNNIGDIPYRPVKLFSYVVNRTPEAIILMRSLFTDIINFSEKVSPVFTPDNLLDTQPLMKPIPHDKD
ncbi:MAG: nitrous oxide reductase family maturation protein NosD [Aureisphaera sp.]